MYVDPSNPGFVDEPALNAGIECWNFYHAANRDAAADRLRRVMEVCRGTGAYNEADKDTEIVWDDNEVTRG